MRHPIVLSVTLALVAAVSLSSCAASPGSNGDAAPLSSPASAPASPSSRPTDTAALPSSTPSPSATEAAAVPAVPAVPASIIIGAEAIDVVDASGAVITSLPYSGEGDAAVARLIEVLGTPERTEQYPETPHLSPVDGTIWGGLIVGIHRYGADDGRLQSDQRYVPKFSVQADSALTNTGVDIVAIDGTQVGDSLAEAADGKPAEQVYRDETFGFGSVAVQLPTSFPGITTDGDSVRAYGVIAMTDNTVGSDVITSITAPEYLYSLF